MEDRSRQAGSTPGELNDPVVVDFPLRGEWTAVNTPAHRIPSHGTDQLGQRYAYDLVRTDPARRGMHLHPAGTIRSYLIGGRTRECYGWGQPVHAPFDGEVVRAVDGVPERAWMHVARELALVLKNTVTFHPDEQGVAALAGNHVILRMDDEPTIHAFVAHLTTGSVAVEEGTAVRPGDLIGRVGHTGNSTAPHLHFQLMDGPDPLRAGGIPCAFRGYEARSGERWVPVERGFPRKGERIRSVP